MKVKKARREDLPCFYARASGVDEETAGKIVEISNGEVKIKVPVLRLPKKDGETCKEDVILLPKVFRMALRAKPKDDVRVTLAN